TNETEAGGRGLRKCCSGRDGWHSGRGQDGTRDETAPILVQIAVCEGRARRPGGLGEATERGCCPGCKEKEIKGLQTQNGRLECHQEQRLCGRNSVVECQLPKLDVAGSNPVARSRINRSHAVATGLNSLRNQGVGAGGVWGISPPPKSQAVSAALP